MISLRDIAYVRLNVSDLDAAAAFARHVIGLQPEGSTSGTRYFRSDSRSHSLALLAAPGGRAGDHVVAFDVDDTADLDSASAALEAEGYKVRYGSTGDCDSRHVKAMVGFRDPSGNAIELVVRHAESGKQFIPQRDVDIRCFNHVGLWSTDTRRDEYFWTRVCNARVSDRIGDVPLMRINAIHHTIALAPATSCGLHHINHQVGSTDDILRAAYFLREQGVPLVFGPGRHPTSGARFLYFRGPDNVVFEYSVGVDEIADEASHRARQFNAEPWSLCQWGSLWDNGVGGNEPPSPPLQPVSLRMLGE
ncbi:MAG: VOC family protein [Caulobacterales bacterium]